LCQALSFIRATFVCLPSMSIRPIRMSRPVEIKQR
jgi:hypothetical protein